MPTTPQPASTTLPRTKWHNAFKTGHADIVLRSGGAKPLLFKAAKAKLASASPVFAGMLEAGSDDQGPRHEGLPLVQLHECSRVIAYLLCYVDNDISGFRDLADLRADMTVKLYDASVKYEMSLVQALVEGHLRRSIVAEAAKFDLKIVMRLYALACRERRTLFARELAAFATRYKPSQWPQAIIAQLGGADVHALHMARQQANEVGTGELVKKAAAIDLNARADSSSSDDSSDSSDDDD